MPIPATLQDLPPASAHLCLEVERFMRACAGDEIADATWLIALSGGLDSTALLIMARCLAPRSRARLLAAHLDHGLRPESGHDARHVAELCQSLSIPLVSAKADVAAHAKAHGLGIEEAGRELRYLFLAKQAADHRPCLILTAHQADDLAEDVVMRLTRGAGWPELAGMVAHDPERGLLRPLLATPRATLQAFLEEMGAPWLSDASNQDTTFTRNRVRHELIPLLLRENANFLEAVSRLRTLADLDRDFWEKRLAAALPAPDDQGRIRLPRSALDRLHPAERLRLFKRAVELTGPGQPLMENLLALERALKAKATGKIIQFPGAKHARITPTEVVVSPALDSA